MALFKKVVMACMVLQAAMVIQAADMNHNKQGNLEILQSLTPFEPKSDMEVLGYKFFVKKNNIGKYYHVPKEIVFENVYNSPLKNPVYTSTLHYTIWKKIVLLPNTGRLIYCPKRSLYPRQLYFFLPFCLLKRPNVQK